MNYNDHLSERRSGVIPVRWRDGQMEVLLITSRQDGRWIIPKGHIDPATTSGESAAREAFEEAGVTGQLHPTALGSYHHHRGDEVHEVEVFQLDVEHVLDTWPEEDERDRSWFTVEKALEHLDSQQLRGFLHMAASRACETMGIPPSTLSASVAEHNLTA